MTITAKQLQDWEDEVKHLRTTMNVQSDRHQKQLSELRERLRWFELWEQQVRRFLTVVEENARQDGAVDRARMDVVTFEARTPKP